MYDHVIASLRNSYSHKGRGGAGQGRDCFLETGRATTLSLFTATRGQATFAGGWRWYWQRRGLLQCIEK